MLPLYLASCAGRGLAAGTIRLRAGYLSRVPDLDTATTDQLVLWLGSHTWSPGTRNGVLAVLRGYYRWLVRRGDRIDNPTEGIDPVRVPAAVPRPAPDDVVAAAVLAGDDRARLMVVLGAGAGLRRAEIAALRWADHAGGVLYVTGKGGRRRQVPVSPVVAGVLDAEQRRRLAGQPGTGFGGIDVRSRFVFPGSVDGHLSPKSVARVVGQALGPGWTTHTLRHRFASLAYGAGHDMLQVQQLLGHSSPATTARYVAVDPSSAAAAVLAASSGLLSS